MRNISRKHRQVIALAAAAGLTGAQGALPAHASSVNCFTVGEGGTEGGTAAGQTPTATFDISLSFTSDNTAELSILVQDVPLFFGAGVDYSWSIDLLEPIDLENLFADYLLPSNGGVSGSAEIAPVESDDTSDPPATDPDLSDGEDVPVVIVDEADKDFCHNVSGETEACKGLDDGEEVQDNVIVVPWFEDIGGDPDNQSDQPDVAPSVNGRFDIEVVSPAANSTGFLNEVRMDFNGVSCPGACLDTLTVRNTVTAVPPVPVGASTLYLVTALGALVAAPMLRRAGRR